MERANYYYLPIGDEKFLPGLSVKGVKRDSAHIFLRGLAILVRQTTY